jgi:sulfatase maturation enzyme AslB (radical SAM superfamily)
MSYRYMSVETLRSVMLDYTTRCNALCLRCARNTDGKYINKNMPLENMPWAVFEKFFTETINYIERIDYCGSFGDPILHPDLIRGIEWLRRTDDPARRRELNRDPLYIEVATNGGVNKPAWWAELATALGSQNAVVFGIDGLEDTNDLYRRQVIWKRLMENVEAFISAGGHAVWQFILFEHNEHQVHLAEELAQRMGFKRFFVIDNYNKSTKGPGSTINLAFLNHVYNRPDNIGAKTKKYDNTIISNQSENSKHRALEYFTEKLNENYNGDIDEFLSRAPVKCGWWEKERASLSLMFNGEIWPCCHVGEFRFPKAEPWDSVVSDKFIGLYDATHGKYGNTFNNIQHYTLEEILDHEWFSYNIVSKWEGKQRHHFCALKCSTI